MRPMVGVLFSLCVVGAAHAQVDAVTQAKLDSAARLGGELYDYSRSVDRVTEKFRVDVPQAVGQDVPYVTERVDADHVKTTFIFWDGNQMRVLYSGVTNAAGLVSVESFAARVDRPPTTPAQDALYSATRIVRGATEKGACGRAVSVIGMPGEVTGETYVYALVPDASPREVQMGGHMRFTFDAEGQFRDDSLREFSNSCLALDRTDASVGLMITLPANIGGTPTEIHVLKSLQYGIPIFVNTVLHIWEVGGDRITLIERRN